MAYGIPKPQLPTRQTSIGLWQEPSTLSSTIWELEASDASGRFGHQRQKSYLPLTAPSPIAAARQHAAAAAAPRRTGQAFGRERDYRARSPVRSDGNDSHFDGGHPKCTSATARAPISAELPYPLQDCRNRIRWRSIDRYGLERYLLGRHRHPLRRDAWDKPLRDDPKTHKDALARGDAEAWVAAERKELRNHTRCTSPSSKWTAPQWRLERIRVADSFRYSGSTRPSATEPKKHASSW